MGPTVLVEHVPAVEGKKLVLTQARAEGERDDDVIAVAVTVFARRFQRELPVEAAGAEVRRVDAIA